MARGLLLGTTKGVFLLSDGVGGWAVSGPFCEGWPINHVIGDATMGRLWAAGGSDWHGPGIWRSADGGQNWVLSTAGLEGVAAMWSLHLTGRGADARLLAGAKPATLFESRDGGATWGRVQGLSDHPSGPGWEPGAAGLTLHSIVSDPGDPARVWVGISAAGVFATEDGGATWDRRNRRANAATAAEGETGLCVHNLARAPGAAGDLIYQQNHHGVWRSADGGLTWDDLGAGLPSTFGFPVAVHPRDPQTLWVFPLNGDSAGRFPPEAAAAVWRSRDGGASWHALREGLPARDCFFTVLRQAMAVEPSTPAALYFGTNSGSVFASADEGESWSEIARHLPTILSVEVMPAP
jgi:photosystem II stability/assembly factor-like uncharacterized protein